MHVALGFQSGLPLLLVLGRARFSLRMRSGEAATIGYLSWWGRLAFKWCWAPLVDRLPIPLLTQALGPWRSWCLVSQLASPGGLVEHALADRAHERWGVGGVVCPAGGGSFQPQDDCAGCVSHRVCRHRHQGCGRHLPDRLSGWPLHRAGAQAGVLWVAAWAECRLLPPCCGA